MQYEQIKKYIETCELKIPSDYYMQVPILPLIINRKNLSMAAMMVYCFIDYLEIEESPFSREIRQLAQLSRLTGMSYSALSNALVDLEKCGLVEICHLASGGVEVTAVPVERLYGPLEGQFHNGLNPVLFSSGNLKLFDRYYDDLSLTDRKLRMNNGHFDKTDNLVMPSNLLSYAPVIPLITNRISVKTQFLYVCMQAFYFSPPTERGPIEALKKVSGFKDHELIHHLLQLKDLSLVELTFDKDDLKSYTLLKIDPIYGPWPNEFEGGLRPDLLFQLRRAKMDVYHRRFSQTDGFLRTIQVTDDLSFAPVPAAP